MPEVALLIEKVIDGVNLLQGRVDAKEWKNYSRTSFIYNLTQTISELEEIASLLEMIDGEFKREGLGDAPDINEYIEEINSLIVLLKRNQKMEEDSIERAKKTGIFELGEEVEKPEVYSSLEQKVLGLLLKVRYLTDRINVYVNKREIKPYTPAKAQRNILDLLEQKEEELHKVKQKFEELKSKSFFGRMEEGTSSDLEEELNELSRSIESENSVLLRAVEEQKKRLEEVNGFQLELESRIKKFEEFSAEHIAKTMEIITMLKKERDYAKKIVLEMEHETMQLRSSYSRELLAIEEEKMRAREVASQKFKKQITRLQKELAEKGELLQQFKKMVEDRERRIEKLEQKLDSEKEAKKVLRKPKKKPKRAKRKKK